MVDYIADVEQFATVEQLKEVIGEANELMQKAVEFFNKHKQRGTFSKHSPVQLACLSCSQSQYSEKVVAAFSPSAKEELEGLQGSFSRIKEKFDRGIAVQITSILQTQLRALCECLYGVETFIDTIPFCPRQLR